MSCNLTSVWEFIYNNIHIFTIISVIQYIVYRFKEISTIRYHFPKFTVFVEKKYLEFYKFAASFTWNNTKKQHVFPKELRQNCFLK